MNDNIVIIDGKHMIGNYQAFPIYAFELKWKEEVNNLSVDNGTYFTIMYKEEQTEDTLREVLRFHLDEYKKTKTISTVTTLSYKLLMYETWNLKWFSHYTYDLGQTDEQAKDSFEQYVQRHEGYQNDAISFKQEGKICLMGAEDRYRWHSKSEKDDEPNYDQVPCRCEHCKNQGLLRIDH